MPQTLFKRVLPYEKMETFVREVWTQPLKISHEDQVRAYFWCNRWLWEQFKEMYNYWGDSSCHYLEPFILALLLAHWKYRDQPLPPQVMLGGYNVNIEHLEIAREVARYRRHQKVTTTVREIFEEIPCVCWIDGCKENPEYHLTGYDQVKAEPLFAYACEKHRYRDGWGARRMEE
jgi:hypothetical protein